MKRLYLLLLFFISQNIYSLDNTLIDFLANPLAVISIAKIDKESIFSQDQFGKFILSKESQKRNFIEYYIEFEHIKFIFWNDKINSIIINDKNIILRSELEFTMKKNDIIKIFGEPDEYDTFPIHYDSYKYGYSLWEKNSHLLQIRFKKNEDEINEIVWFHFMS